MPNTAQCPHPHFSANDWIIGPYKGCIGVPTMKVIIWTSYDNVVIILWQNSMPHYDISNLRVSCLLVTQQGTDTRATHAWKWLENNLIMSSQARCAHVLKHACIMHQQWCMRHMRHMFQQYDVLGSALGVFNMSICHVDNQHIGTFWKYFYQY